MVEETLGYEELMELPIEVLYKFLYRDYKKLLVEKGKDESYIQELEDEVKSLKRRLVNLKSTPIVEQKIFEYKRDTLHRNMVETINKLTESRDYYKNKYKEIIDGKV